MPESKTLVRGGRDRLWQTPRRSLWATKSNPPAVALTGKTSPPAPSALRCPDQLIYSPWEASEWWSERCAAAGARGSYIIQTGRSATEGCAGALVHIVQWFMGGSILILAAECTYWCSRLLHGGLFAHVGRVVDQLVRAAAAAAPISGVLCGLAAGSLAEQSALLME